jgi:hypothetical protein
MILQLTTRHEYGPQPRSQRDRSIIAPGETRGLGPVRSPPSRRAGVNSSTNTKLIFEGPQEKSASAGAPADRSPSRGRRSGRTHDKAPREKSNRARGRKGLSEANPLERRSQECEQSRTGGAGRLKAPLFPADTPGYAYALARSVGT